MKFEELYNNSMELWPEVIDISDGEIVENGVLFKELSLVWHEVEASSKLKGEWYDLMAWVVFKNLHNIAKRKLQERGSAIEKTKVNRDKIKHDFIANLQEEDYRDMLDDFVRANQVS